MNEFNVISLNRRRTRISSAVVACCAFLLFAGPALTGATAARAAGDASGAGDSLAPSAAYDPEPPVSRWGPGDEAGSSNTQTPAKVLQAVRHIRKGKKYTLGHAYEPTMPLFPGNTHALELKLPITLGRQTGNFDFYHGDIGQNGTQFDALGHFGLQPEGSLLFTDAALRFPLCCRKVPSGHLSTSFDCLGAIPDFGQPLSNVRFRRSFCATLKL
jgi:hypothetical protein